MRGPNFRSQLCMGMKVELEHGKVNPKTDVTGDDPIKTKKIALAHLNELPDYYTRLAKMERDGKKAWKLRESTGEAILALRRKNKVKLGEKFSGSIPTSAVLLSAKKKLKESAMVWGAPPPLPAEQQIRRIRKMLSEKQGVSYRYHSLLFESGIPEIRHKVMSVVKSGKFHRVSSKVSAVAMGKKVHDIGTKAGSDAVSSVDAHGFKPGMREYQRKHATKARMFIPKDEKTAHKLADRGALGHVIHGSARYAMGAVPHLSSRLSAHSHRYPKSSQFAMRSAGGVNVGRYFAKVANAKRGLHRVGPRHVSEEIKAKVGVVSVPPQYRSKFDIGVNSRVRSLPSRGGGHPKALSQKTSSHSGERQGSNEGVLSDNTRAILERGITKKVMGEEESALRKAGRFTAGAVGGAVGAGLGSLVSPGVGTVGGAIVGDVIGSSLVPHKDKNLVNRKKQRAPVVS